MKSLSDRFNDESITVSHEESTVRELQDSISTLKDVTDMRVYVAKFPFGSINYDEDDNYRKTGVDPQSDKIRNLGEGIQNAGLQQPIGLFASELDRNQLQSIIDNCDLENPETWSSDIQTIFGNRRYLAITHHTNLSHAGAYIYPKEADGWRKTIAFIENMDREDVPLIEEAVGLYNEVKERFDGNISRFAAFSGRANDVLSRMFKIGQAAKEDGTFFTLVKNEKTKDLIALDHLARSILSESSDHRAKKVDALMREILDHSGKIELFRKKAKQIKDYAEGKGNVVPNISENKPAKQAKNTAESAEGSQKPSESRKSRAHLEAENLKNRLKSIKIDEIDDVLKEELRSIKILIEELSL